jgi:hypothetical protein
MGNLHIDQIKTDRARFGAFGPDAVAHGFLGVLRHQGLELALGALVVGVGLPGSAKQPGELLLPPV